MIESILDQEKPVPEALKQLNKFDEWLDEDDITILRELKLSIENFKSLTLLVSEYSANLLLLPRLHARLLKACKP